MMRVAVMFAALAAADATRGSGTAHMQPEVVAHSLVKMEEEWKAQALAFVGCNGSSASDDDMSACARAPKAFEASCSTVVNAVVQASSGDKLTVHEYMSDICGEKQLQGWMQTRCQNLATVVIGHMTASNLRNRQDFDGQGVCHKFWKEVVQEETVNAAKAAAEEAAERAEDAKQAVEEDAKAAEQKKKDEEARQFSNWKAEKETAKAQLKAKVQTDQNAQVTAEADANATQQSKKDVDDSKAADAHLQDNVEQALKEAQQLQMTNATSNATSNSSKILESRSAQEVLHAAKWP